MSDEGKSRELSVLFKDKDTGKVFGCLMERVQIADEIADDTGISPGKVVKILLKLKKMGFVILHPC